MRFYQLKRHRSVRITEYAIAPFPSDDEAIEAARHSHDNAIVDYEGKYHPLIPEGQPTDPLLADESWFIERKDDDKKWYPVLPESVHFNEQPTTGDLLELLDDLSELDPDWPSDIRALRSVIARARAMVKSYVGG